jgi:very-short-patch-repair endonuclease
MPMANDRARFLRRNQTPAERALWALLRQGKQQGIKFRRQHPIGRYIVDFACIEARLAVEVDGEQHGRDDGLAHDAMRDFALSGAGFEVMRFWNHEALKRTNKVADQIFARALERRDELHLAAREAGT